VEARQAIPAGAKMIASTLSYALVAFLTFIGIVSLFMAFTESEYRIGYFIIGIFIINCAILSATIAGI
jgi:hypothetical protein